MIGCDPELVLMRDGLEVSAFGIIPGTKEQPFDIGCGYVHPDNVMAEFNTIPADNAVDFSQSVQSCLDVLGEMVDKAGCTISHESVGMFDVNDPSEMEAGCQPDYNAYTGTFNIPPDYSITELRSAGGHVHIGAEIVDIPRFIRVCDLMITVPMLKAENPIRREFYGKAGAFREKSYGAEYRTPSNAWVFAHNTRLWMYNQVERVKAEYLTLNPPSMVEEAINNHDITLASELVAEYNITPFGE